MEKLSTSKQLFYQLAERLKNNIAGLSVSETDKWCGLYQKSGKRFAYILLAKRKPKVSIWCFGNVDYIKHKYAGKIKFLTRQKTSGEFGKKFQISFVIENLEDIENAALLLIEISDSWSREELISAFNLYCTIPIKEIESKNAKIIEFAVLLGKTAKEVAKRFKNFSRLDANINIRTYAFANKYCIVAGRQMIAFCSYHDIRSLIRAVSSFTKAMNEAKMWVFCAAAVVA